MEDKREQIRKAPDARQQRQWAQEAEREKAAAFNAMTIEEKEQEYRERARLSVLNLTARDKRFLQALKVKGD